MSLVFNSNKIIPAPLVETRRPTNFSGDGEPISGVWNITLTGILLPDKGSPNSSGTFHNASGYPADEVVTHDSRLASLLVKKQALEQLFSPNNNGKLLEIQPLDGSAPTRANVRILDISFTRRGNDPWVDSIPYTITLEADCLYVVGNDCDMPVTNYITDVQDEWSIEPADDINLTYRLTRRVSATGKRSYNASGDLVKTGWENAQDYILNVVGLGINEDRKNSVGVINLTSWEYYNHSRSQTINERAGTFSVTESWLLYDSVVSGGFNAIDEYTVEARINQNGFTEVNVQGTIRGLEVRNSEDVIVSTRYQNAEALFTVNSLTMLARAQNYAGTTLNPLLLASSVGRNPYTGVIQYTFTYNNRSAQVVPGSISESITETYDNPADVFAQIPVIGRLAGPIIQSIGSSTARTKNVSIEVAMPANTYGFTVAAPDTTALVLSLRPAGSIIKTARDTESWIGKDGRYSRNVSWVYEV